MIEYDVFHIHEHLSLDANICSLVDFSIGKTAAQKKNQTDNEKNTRKQPCKTRPEPAEESV